MKNINTLLHLHIGKGTWAFLSKHPFSFPCPPLVDIMKPLITLHQGERNLFYIMSKVRRALVMAGRPADANECERRVRCTHTYEEMISIVKEYVDINWV